MSQENRPYKSDYWFDETYWSISAPSSWSVISRSNEHIFFQLDNGDSVMIGVRKKTDRSMSMYLSKNEKISIHESEIDPYVSTRSGATYNSPRIPLKYYSMIVHYPVIRDFLTEKIVAPIERKTCNDMIGYISYRPSKENQSEKPTFGYFSLGDWKVYIDVTANRDSLEYSMTKALNILRTFQSHT